MFRIHCKNAVSEEGLQSLLPNFTLTERQEEADGILVRSADMHEEKLGEATLAVARAGAGVNNIPLERFAEEGVVVFNTPGANANSVKELVICEMLLAARNVIPAVHWVAAHKDTPDIAKEAEKGKKQFVGTEICGKKLGVVGLGAIGAEVANAAVALGMEVYGERRLENQQGGAARDLARGTLQAVRLHHHPCPANRQEPGHDRRKRDCGHERGRGLLKLFARQAGR